MQHRNLAQWLTYLEQLHPSEIDMGLERVKQVAEQLHLTQPAQRVVTVTGTNGKGSTCAMLAALLQAQGLQVGVYSSPHMLHYNERVRINAEQATDAQLCQAFTAVEQARGEVTLTYFEMGTLAALWLFSQAALDVAILEVGLGGRLDAVNIIDADIAIVTSIAVDHTEYLGNTRESVAYEKSGIFRKDKFALCGDPNPPQMLLDRAKEIGAKLLLRSQGDFDLAITDDHWHWQGRDEQGQRLQINNLPLINLPISNAAIVLQAFELLGGQLSLEEIAKVLSQVQLPGRLQHIDYSYQNRTCHLLLDVAHNPHAATYLASRLAQQPKKRLAVFSVLADKDINFVIEPLLPLIDSWAVAALPTARSRSVEDIEQSLRSKGANVTGYASIEQALAAQCANASSQDEILVFGSFFTVAQVLALLEKN